jgi:hypothetical protein
MSDETKTSEEIKRIPIKEFRDLGFIQEINRLLLHPCGLALEAIVDLDTGEATLGGVWDYRDDPEGIRFQDGVLSREKKESVDDLFYSKAQYRRDNLGYFVQPIPEEEDVPPVLVVTDPDIVVPADLPEEGTLESLKETHPEFHTQVQEMFKQGEEELKRRGKEGE